MLQKDTPLDPSAEYSVSVNNFIAAGGDSFTVLTAGTDQVDGPIDLDALIEFLAAQPQPIAPPAIGRITSGLTASGSGAGVSTRASLRRSARGPLGR